MFIKTYRDTLVDIKLDGPTFFAPVINRVFQFVEECEGNPEAKLYHVLLILTDGGIHDMRETINQIVKCSTKPLSIIIVGIGDAEFKNMDILDADDFALYDSNGVRASRDIVQFVKYNDFIGDPCLLAEHILCEVPDQLVSYMSDNGK